MTLRRFRGHRIGRLIVTTCYQPAGSETRRVDDAITYDHDDRCYHGRAILLRRSTGRALVIGWRNA